MGVNTMFELATRHPERVRGLFAVAGVPGGTFATMLGPLHLPHSVAGALTTGVARLVHHSGRALSPLTRRLPIGPWTISALGRTGFMFPVPDRELAATAVREFLQTPVDWYAHLALRTSEHARVRLSQVGVPCFLVAGRWDVLSGARDMFTAAERLDQATYVELNGTHFLQMEQPERVHALLLEFLERVG
jgi:pimeloyl-ACP methyl ester carboxylesterase